MDYSVINKRVEDFQNELKEQKLYDDIDVYVFPQTWGSTALGYGGIGGSIMTTASTIVLHSICENIFKVYFGGGLLAYQIKDPNPLFAEDLYKHRLEGKSKFGKYIRKD
jgi:hypothetical protein